MFPLLLGVTEFAQEKKLQRKKINIKNIDLISI